MKLWKRVKNVGNPPRYFHYFSVYIKRLSAEGSFFGGQNTRHPNYRQFLHPPIHPSFTELVPYWHHSVMYGSIAFACVLSASITRLITSATDEWYLYSFSSSSYITYYSYLENCISERICSCGFYHNILSTRCR